jgi:hypothetical protein
MRTISLFASLAAILVGAITPGKADDAAPRQAARHVNVEGAVTKPGAAKFPKNGGLTIIDGTTGSQVHKTVALAFPHTFLLTPAP